MLQEFELFSKFFPEEYLNTVEIEYQKIKEETKIMAYLKAFTEVLEKLILDESVYTTFKKGFSQNEINNILKMTIRLIFFSLEEKGVTGLINKDVFTGNEDPTIKSWYSFLYMKQQDIETKYKNLQNEWKKLEKISHSDNINIILDKLDILFIVIKMAQQKLDQKNLEKFIQLFFEIIQSAEPKELILQLYSIIGKTTDAFIKMSQGNMDAAKKLIDQTLEEAKELQNPFIKSQVYNILGVYLSGEGHLNNALKQYQLSAEYATKISQQSYRYMAALANISDIYLRQGKYEEGLAITNKAIEIFTDQAFVPKLNKAHIISLQGNHTEALREIEGILEDYPAETIDKNYYFYLRRIQFESYIELSEFEKAEEVILEMDQMITSSKAKQFQAYIFYFQGLIEFKKVNFTLAKQLLLKAIESSYKAVDGLSLRLKAEFQLSNVLLNSYKFSESINDFQKALTLMETVIKAAEEQNIYILLCNALTIHARMLDIQDKEKQAISSLKKALSIANNYDLTVIKKRIEEQLALLEKQTEKVSKKEKTTGLIGYLAKFLRSMLTFEGTTQVKEIPSKIHGLMVASNTGLALYSHYYNKKMKADDQLISGLLSAVSVFIMEVFEQESGGSLKSITHENITILLEKLLEDYSLVFFADKDTSEVRSKLIQLAENVEQAIKAQDSSPDEIETQNKYREIIEPILTDFFPKKMIE